MTTWPVEPSQSSSPHHAASTASMVVRRIVILRQSVVPIPSRGCANCNTTADRAPSTTPQAEGVASAPCTGSYSFTLTLAESAVFCVAAALALELEDGTVRTTTVQMNGVQPRREWTEVTRLPVASFHVVIRRPAP